jgi:hypothetical protein
MIIRVIIASSVVVLLSSTTFSRNQYLFLKVTPSVPSNAIVIRVDGLYSIGDSKTSLSICNSFGIPVLDLTAEMMQQRKNGFAIIKTSVKEMARGMYFVVVASQNTRLSSKILVMK